MAGPFLKAAAISLEETMQTIQELGNEIRVCMFAAGAGDMSALKHTPLVEDKG
jgi:isopentenyl diphosphate isomerase/L-lactate dehydrogenase-like FMN-dependent dehydrogenase